MLRIFRDGLRRLQIAQRTVFASVEAGTQLNLPSSALVLVPNTFGLMGIGGELVCSK